MAHPHHYEPVYESRHHPLHLLNVSIGRLEEEHALLQDGLMELYKLAKLICRKENDGLSWIGTLRDLRKKAVDFKADLNAHAWWEETELFPMVGSYFDEGLEQLMLMEQEHELAERFILAFLEAAERAPVRHYDAKQMAAYLLQAHTILTNHFRHEEEVLTALWEKSNDYGY
ncbi:MAG TPA: hemerythrin domain-containing protein [Paenibacillus sp.]|uniref:hemerythrin domain-containing protein n=1 Tax=Paenibacillus sp. TaxID=58172 RepID=UPI002D15EE84|nr:hemerythrin domain-containing protein [Paenibacillus sp.]HUC94213.1 hemerythrin domain-containing protein [Paenibacillus sp.]